ncbi:hypothetical protein [Acetohalobium arabaticum]|uniref:Uncharacterized protein n=1 Tax=Acetohalobium arabaticum (strain ATCC 49924 / DSM 5501 / Z-7288) TaxID=574087 RepID=D9QST4_ACEAZ|nr:hypothetical protein [Acetohalobium arabaticum]ADL11622.1 hypothetical protein Acear_0071 [Acetohalobium arabaticum DSM 5501]
MKTYRLEEEQVYSTQQREVSRPQVYSTYLDRCGNRQNRESKPSKQSPINRLVYKKQNLIRNGDFSHWKNQDQPKFWQGKNITQTSTSKTGAKAVQLNQITDGESKNGSQLWQKGECCSNIKVNLQFSIATLIIDSSKPLPCNPEITVELNWLDSKGDKLDTGLEFIIPADSIPAAQWTFFSRVSSAAPQGTEGFLLLFAVDAGTPVALDNLNLITL